MFSKIGTIIYAIISWPFNWIWKKNPTLMMSAEISRATQQAKLAQDSLSKQKGMLNRLERNKNEIETKKKNLEKKIELLIKQGKKEDATTYARNLVTVNGEYTRAITQYENQKKLYENNKIHISKAAQEITSAQDDLVRLENELEISKAVKQTSQINQSLDGKINTSNLADARRVAQSTIDENYGYAETAKELSDSISIDDKLEEQMDSADVEAILSQFEDKILQEKMNTENSQGNNYEKAKLPE